MKKYIGIILLIIACTLTSCGEDETTAAAPEPVSGSEILDESKPEQISSVEIRDEGTVYVKTFSDGSVSGDEPLPLELKITYELDGVDLTADEIKDKSGHLKMRFEYKNMTAYKSVQAPLAAVTVMMLDEEVFSNIVAQNARVSKTGDAWLCMGATFPGLKDSLGLSGWERTKDIDIPEDFTIEADVKDFKTEFAFVAASVISPEDLTDEDIDELGDISDGIADLEKAGKSLKKAAKALSDGANDIKDKLTAYVDTVDSLAGGIDSLDKLLSKIVENGDGNEDIKNAKELAASLNEGASGLKNSSGAIKEAIGGLSSGISSLYDGIKEFYDKGIKELADETGEGFDDIIDRLRELKAAGENYIYPGTGEKADFIYEIQY